jgi:hypothetical protein
MLGRNFSPDEDWSGGPNVPLLSDRLWRNKLNAAPKIVGKAITLNGAEYTVIGVLLHFSFPSLYLEPDLYGPAVLEAQPFLSIANFGEYRPLPGCVHAWLSNKPRRRCKPTFKRAQKAIPP